MNEIKPLWDLTVAIKGAGDLASGIACRLYQARIRKIYLLEVPGPLAVRRRVAFSEAVYDGKQTVEGVSAVRVDAVSELEHVWASGKIAVKVDPTWVSLVQQPPDIVIDAILAKKNLGTRLDDAPLVIGMGPGFAAGRDVHRVIETKRGHHFGRIIKKSAAEENTGIPGSIAGCTTERVLRAPADGRFESQCQLGDQVHKGQTIASVYGIKITAQISGMLRGLIRPGVMVSEGLKVGDIDPRGLERNCDTISDKARGLGGAVLEAILEKYNLPFQDKMICSNYKNSELFRETEQIHAIQIR
jgi:xanthine dehydrogenase accessory factor